jgi:hypothetical protein
LVCLHRYAYEGGTIALLTGGGIPMVGTAEQLVDTFSMLVRVDFDGNPDFVPEVQPGALLMEP